MSKCAEGRSHVEHLVQNDRVPQKEEAMLVFQSLVITWCVINNYPARLLKKFTVYDFVNFVKKGNSPYVCDVTDGNKYKFRRALKFNEFEKKVMTFYFKRVRPFWINAFDVLKDSFLTELLDLTLQEVKQSFLYNSQGKNNWMLPEFVRTYKTKWMQPTGSQKEDSSTSQLQQFSKKMEQLVQQWKWSRRQPKRHQPTPPFLIQQLKDSWSQWRWLRCPRTNNCSTPVIALPVSIQ